MIKLMDITKYYSTGYVKTFALRDINLEVEEGEFMTVMGPSGS
jgi:putative ABC transport system ATP-binding protein